MTDGFAPSISFFTPRSQSNTLRWGVLSILITALVAGLAARQWAYQETDAIRFALNQENTFYWGDKIVHPLNAGGAANEMSFWRAYVAIYDADAAHPQAEPHTLDYVPLRLLMAGLWVKYLNITYGPVSQWRPEFARSFAAFSMVMELAGAIAMFVLVSRWLRRCENGSNADQTLFCRSGWGRDRLGWDRWGQASAAAILLWLNPASIVDSHVWPHGQTWILPFYLFAVLAIVESRFFACGVLIGLGTMFKGQMMLVAPVLILWPMFDRKWLAALRVVLGMACSIVIVAWPWIMQGSFAWERTGFASHVGFTNVLRKGDAQNFPALLEKVFHMTLHQHVLDRTVANMHWVIELRTVLIVVYSTLIICVSWGIARQARLGRPALLASNAAPWALMFFILGQMDERYLVWCACFSAGAIVVNRRTLAAHVMLSVAGVVSMLEFLLICAPKVHPSLMRVLIAMNPAVWLMTALAVTLLFLQTITLGRDSTQRAS